MAAGQLSLTDPDLSIGEELASWGKVALLETIGRTTARPATTGVGFFEDPDGSLLVAAGSESADWVLNLRANSHCRATIGDRVRGYEASEIADDAALSHAISELILKYGTPAEKLGHGPVFRLTPLEA